MDDFGDIDQIIDIKDEIKSYDARADKLLNGAADSLLHRAVKHCFPNVIKQVLGLGVNVNATNLKRQNALHYAAQRKGQIREIFEMLFKRGANGDLQDQYLNTPLHYLIANPEADLFSLSEIFGHRVNVNLDNRWGKTPLHIALETDCCPVIHIIYLDLYGANFNLSTGLSNYYPFHCALQRKNCTTELLQVVGKTRSPINARNSVGDTALLHALRNPNVTFGIIQKLLDFGADLNVLNEDNVSPMCQAVIYSCPIPILDLMYFKGANLGKGVNILEKAIEGFNDQPSIEKMIVIKKVIRLLLLENIRYDVPSMIRNSEGPPELYPYPKQCISELLTMQGTTFATEITALDILFKTAEVEPVTEDLLNILAAGKFPVYIQEFSSFFTRRDMENQFQTCQVHSYAKGPNSRKKTILFYDDVLSIVSHLKEIDVFMFLLAFYPFKYPQVLPIDDSDVDDTKPKQKDESAEKAKRKQREAPGTSKRTRFE